MSAPEAVRRRVYPDLGQFMVRALIVIGGTTAIVAAQAAGAVPATWQQGVVIGLAVLTAIKPESIAGVGLLAGAAYTWAQAPETLSPLVLLAAAGMVVAHVSALLAGQGPARMRVDGAQAWRWAGRGLVLWIAAATVWGLGLAFDDLPERRLAYALGLTVLTITAVATTFMISNRPDRAMR